jgi:hypothetical protein
MLYSFQMSARARPPALANPRYIVTASRVMVYIANAVTLGAVMLSSTMRTGSFEIASSADVINLEFEMTTSNTV